MRFLTVTLNPAIDLVGETQVLQLGGVNRIQTLSHHPAGKGINVAYVLARLGANVVATGFLGEENADIFRTFFQQNHIEDKFIYLAGKTRTNIKITQGKDTTDLNFSGFRVPLSAWQALCQQSLTWHQFFDCVVICGSLPQGVSPEMFAQWCESLTVQGVRWVLDSSQLALKLAVKAQPFLLKPNNEELQILSSNSATLTCSQQFALAQSLCQGNTQFLLLSKGEKGAFLFRQNHNEILHARLVCPKVISTTGAGDSLLASFLFFALQEKKDLTDALKYATTIATLVVEQAGLDWQSSLLSTRLTQVAFSSLPSN